MRVHMAMCKACPNFERQVLTMRQALERASDWTDGRSTAGQQAQAVKRNEQLAQDSARAESLQTQVLQAVQHHTLLLSAALPRRIFAKKTSVMAFLLGMVQRAQGTVAMLLGRLFKRKAS
jgi:predicted 2-oxoglutarate/Fe(II)-dependent dioxygenase YbiX